MKPEEKLAFLNEDQVLKTVALFCANWLLLLLLEEGKQHPATTQLPMEWRKERDCRCG
jgi:hypothetical protein